MKLTHSFLRTRTEFQEKVQSVIEPTDTAVVINHLWYVIIITHSIFSLVREAKRLLLYISFHAINCLRVQII